MARKTKQEPLGLAEQAKPEVSAAIENLLCIDSAFKVADERKRCAELVRLYIKFDHQQPMFSWHELQALLEAIQTGRQPYYTAV